MLFLFAFQVLADEDVWSSSNSFSLKMMDYLRKQSKEVAKKAPVPKTQSDKGTCPARKRKEYFADALGDFSHLEDVMKSRGEFLNMEDVKEFISDRGIPSDAHQWRLADHQDFIRLYEMQKLRPVEPHQDAQGVFSSGFKGVHIDARTGKYPRLRKIPEQDTVRFFKANQFKDKALACAILFHKRLVKFNFIQQSSTPGICLDNCSAGHRVTYYPTAAKGEKRKNKYVSGTINDAELWRSKNLVLSDNRWILKQGTPLWESYIAANPEISRSQEPTQKGKPKGLSDL